MLEYVDRKGLASLLGISYTKVVRRIAKGELPSPDMLETPHLKQWWIKDKLKGNVIMFKVLQNLKGTLLSSYTIQSNAPSEVTLRVVSLDGRRSAITSVSPDISPLELTSKISLLLKPLE